MTERSKKILERVDEAIEKETENYNEAIEVAGQNCYGAGVAEGARDAYKELVPIVKQLLEANERLAEVLVQSTDGKTRLVVPGDTWRDRVKRVLTVNDELMAKLAGEE